jgi:hypothetical protein
MLRLSEEGEMPMRRKGSIGLTKEQIRRVVLAKLKVVYRDWNFKDSPFSNRRRSGNRRNDSGAFDAALIAGLLGGLSEAIELNNQALITALGRKDLRMRAKAHEQRRKR